MASGEPLDLGAPAQTEADASSSGTPQVSASARGDGHRVSGSEPDHQDRGAVPARADARVSPQSRGRFRDVLHTREAFRTGYAYKRRRVAKVKYWISSARGSSGDAGAPSASHATVGQASAGSGGVTPGDES